MKFIIIGLGNFGTSLAEKLTQMGHEVIGVDKNMEKVEDIKDKVTQAICLDCKHQEAVKNLPLKNTDVVIIGIGEDEGANILTTALIKKMNVPRLISRYVSEIQEAVLEAMEIDEIVRPEEDSAERWANKLSSNSILDSFQISDKYNIIQLKVPKKFIGKSVEEIDFITNYNVIILSVMRNTKEKKLLGLLKKSSQPEIQGIATTKTILQEDEIMVLYGDNKSIQHIVKTL